MAYRDVDDMSIEELLRTVHISMTTGGRMTRGNLALHVLADRFGHDTFKWSEEDEVLRQMGIEQDDAVVVVRRLKIAHIKEHQKEFDEAYALPGETRDVEEYFHEYSHVTELYTNVCNDLEITPKRMDKFGRWRDVNPGKGGDGPCPTCGAEDGPGRPSMPSMSGCPTCGWCY